MSQQEPTPHQVASIATTKTRLSALALIGVFGTSGAPAALVRTPLGAIVRVAPGDVIAGHSVTGIGEDHLVLSKGHKTKVLRLPAT